MVGMVFAGQGTQYLGMGEKMYYEHMEVRELFNQASDIIGLDIKKICFDSDPAKLLNTRIVQPIVYLIGYCRFVVLNKTIGCSPDYLAGHSLGEITALAASGAIAFSQGLEIVKKRGELMQRQSEIKPGGMIGVHGLSKNKIAELLRMNCFIGQSIELACLNAPYLFTISGEKEALKMFSSIAQSVGGRITPLKVSGAFHSSLMKPIREEWHQYLDQIRFGEMSIPVFSAVTGRGYQATWTIQDILSDSLISPVQWMEVLNDFAKENVSLLIDAGPGRSMSDIIKKNIPCVKLYTSDFYDINIEQWKLLQGKPKKKERHCPFNSIIDLCMSEIVGSRTISTISPEDMRYVEGFFRYLKWLYQVMYEYKQELGRRETVSIVLQTQTIKRIKTGKSDLGIKELAYKMNQLGFPLNEQDFIKTHMWIHPDYQDHRNIDWLCERISFNE